MTMSPVINNKTRNLDTYKERLYNLKQDNKSSYILIIQNN